MVKITEELLQKADQIPNFSDGVIMPDGDYRLIEEKGHLQTMMALLPYPEKEIWKMIPENDSALFWMIEKTGCVLTDYNSTVGMVMTRSQKEVCSAPMALPQLPTSFIFHSTAHVFPYYTMPLI